MSVEGGLVSAFHMAFHSLQRYSRVFRWWRLFNSARVWPNWRKFL